MVTPDEAARPPPRAHVDGVRRLGHVLPMLRDDTLTAASPIFGAENVLFLATRVADAVGCLAPEIAALCRSGRPPVVCVLLDEEEPEFAARTRAGLDELGVPDDRQLMLGVRAWSSLGDQGVREAVVRALSFVSWRRDANVLCATAGRGDDRTDDVAAAIAETVARRNGLGLVAYRAGPRDAAIYERRREPLPSAREAPD